MSNVINMKEITIGVHNIRSISFVNNTVQIVESCEDLQHLADTVMAQNEQLGLEFNCKRKQKNYGHLKEERNTTILHPIKK